MGPASSGLEGLSTSSVTRAAKYFAASSTEVGAQGRARLPRGGYWRVRHRSPWKVESATKSQVSASPWAAASRRRGRCLALVCCLQRRDGRASCDLPMGVDPADTRPARADSRSYSRKWSTGLP